MQFYTLQSLYTILLLLRPEINKNIVLQRAFKIINTFVELDSLIPTLLVFKAYP